MDQRRPSLIVVPDASALLDALLPDERGSRDVLDFLKTATAVAPAIWPAEVANALLTAVRRGRITSEEASELLASVAEYDVELVAGGMTEIARDAFPLALTHGLTLYDALYVSLARSRDARLFSFDKEMCAAARKEGVETL